MGELGIFFDQYLQAQSIFRNKAALQAQFIPSQVGHRDDQVHTLARMLAPCLKQEKPSNIFIYGKPGTGKTLVARHVTNSILTTSIERSLPVHVAYANCRLRHIADTEYRLIAHLLKEFGKIVPPTGLPTQEVYSMFYDTLDQIGGQILLLLDEVDELADRAGSDVLYNLTRCNSHLQKARVTVVGICNNLMFTQALDPRVRSSLSEEELVFPPYNAVQLQGILRERAHEAFVPDAIEVGVIEKVAAFAAREHGDARRALDLLRVAGELAERDLSKKLVLLHVDNAEAKLDTDYLVEAVTAQPKQHHAVLFGILRSLADKRTVTYTGEVYTKYQAVCTWAHLRPLTQRRVSDVLGELDTVGLIAAPIISKGRYGRTRQIQLSISIPQAAKINSILEESLAIGSHDNT